jgi:hypothetical protein
MGSGSTSDGSAVTRRRGKVTVATRTDSPERVTKTDRCPMWRVRCVICPPLPRHIAYAVRTVPPPVRRSRCSSFCCCLCPCSRSCSSPSLSYASAIGSPPPGPRASRRPSRSPLPRSDRQPCNPPLTLRAAASHRPSRPSGEHPRRPESDTQGNNSPTHSTWCVIGNRSNARSAASRQPPSQNVRTSRANAAGSHAT